MASFPNFCVGQRIRVWRGTKKEESCVALISYLEVEDRQADVLYGDGGSEEECGVPFESIMELEAFEKEACEDPPPSAQVLKDRGNLLFQKYRDWSSARKMYSLSVALVTPPPSVGARVLVLSQYTTSPNVRPGMVTDLTDAAGAGGAGGQLLDIMYDEDYDEATGDAQEGPLPEDEEGLPMARIAAFLGTEAEQVELQRACFLNMARCYLKERLYGWGVRFASISVCICRLQMLSAGLPDFSEPPLAPQKSRSSPQQQLCDALCVRFKMLLAAHKPQSARRDALAMERLGDPRTGPLLAEVDIFVRERAKSNKKMAKEVANWVETAMALGQQQAGGGGMKA